MKPMHKRFALYRIAGLGKSAAALKAGSSKSSAPANGTRWSNREDVITFIDKHQPIADEASAKASGVDKAFILDELIDNSNQAKALDRPDYKASNQSLGLAAKLLGLLVERSEVVISTEVKDFIEDIIVIMEEEIGDPDMMARIISRIASKYKV